MGKHQKTLDILQVALEVLKAYHPMTVRQVYYQLVSRQVIENNRGQYQAVSTVLVNARKAGEIPWGWVEDRLRRPRKVAMWRDLPDFAWNASHWYRRDVWAEQGQLVEVWLEKDALSGIFEDILRPYGVTLNVGRGYDGWDSLHNAAERYLAWGGDVTILYFGDLDPSGEDMVRSLGERVGFFETRPEIVKVALTAAQVERYNLPPDFTKMTDTRRTAFVAKFGDIAVELDALPIDVLKVLIEDNVRQRMDLEALAAVQETEKTERAQLVDLLAGVR